MANFTFKDEDASKFLKEVIELGGLHEVDTSPDKSIIDTVTDKQVTITTEAGVKPLVLFGSTNGNAAIVNPFSETGSLKFEDSWFYSSRVSIISTVMYQLIRTIIEMAIKANEHDDTTNNSVIQMIPAEYAARLDPTSIEELESLKAEVSKILVIYYNQTKKITEVSTIFSKPYRDVGFPVRMKTWRACLALFNNILGIDDLEELAVKSNLVGCPILDGFVRVYLNVWERLQGYLHLIDHSGHFKKISSSIRTIRNHLKYLDSYKQAASWLRTPSVTPAPTAVVPSGVAVMPTTTVAPAVPVMSSTPMVQQPMMSSAMMPSTPPVAAAPVPVYTAPPMYSTMATMPAAMPTASMAQQPMSYPMGMATMPSSPIVR